jgi:hypothetical protein
VNHSCSAASALELPSNPSQSDLYQILILLYTPSGMPCHATHGPINALNENQTMRISKLKNQNVVLLCCEA